MFSDNKTTSNNNVQSKKKIDLVQDAKIHTMEKDLFEFKNPTNNSQSELETITNEQEKIKLGNKTDIDNSQKISPFLKEEEINNKDQLSSISSLQNQSMKTKSVLKKIIIIIVISISIVGIGGGSFYFWKTRISNTKKIKNTNNQINKSLENTTTNNLSEFSIDKANYLSLDFNKDNKEQILSTLQKYVKKIAILKTTAPIEFVLTNSQNNPISFQDFAQKVNLTLSKNLIDQLGANFSLFIYNDDGNVRLGLAVATNNSQEVKNLLSKEENNLPQEIQFLFLGKDTSGLKGALFSLGKYQGLNIRYYNVVSPEVLSVDYTVYKDQWLVGTTKMTLRSIINYTSKQG